MKIYAIYYEGEVIISDVFQGIVIDELGKLSKDEALDKWLESKKEEHLKPHFNVELLTDRSMLIV